MKRFCLISLLLAAQMAFAVEYHLQYTPSGGALGITVAGYDFSGSTVDGNCSYYISSGGGGRGSHPTITYHYNSCSWDLYGNLISITPQPSAPVAPALYSTSGTEIIYAVNGTSTTGKDTRGFGFVSTLSSHYTWQTGSGGYAVIPYVTQLITATLISDGDFPLVFDGATVVTSVSGTVTPSPGAASIVSNSCGASVAIGTTCSITISYTPKSITCTASPYGYAYTKLDIKLTTDAGANPDFTEGFTITGVPICND